jgi:DNA (cytosine-5)-methyltransferase 1
MGTEMQLVLSLFPGIGLLDMAFEEAGFCVVRGPDLIWGGDIDRFHIPMPGRFEGIIGGPPCQRYSTLAALVRSRYGEDRVAPDKIPDFERVVSEAQPDWFVMENVSGAPEPKVPGYIVHSEMVKDVWVGGATDRLRRFSFGTKDGRRLNIEVMALHCVEPERAVCSSAGGADSTPPMSAKLAGQGLPATFWEGSPFTLEAKRKMVGNGVPLPMGRAVARAVAAAIAE